METKEWTFIDKRSWPQRGPWDNEPDKVQWTDSATGLPCLAVRAVSHWCGYVGVPEGHPAFGKDESDVNVDVHGELTFASKCQAGEGDERVCHVPAPGEPDHVWWLGFDCAHSGDLRPSSDIHLQRLHMTYRGDYQETYRDLEYVKNECRKLAEQLAAYE